MTYLDLYLVALYDLLQVGGKQEAVDATVRELNDPSLTGFKAWLEHVPGLACSTCGKTYKPEDPPLLATEALCPECVSPS
jgi:hypothetical protein